MFCYIYDFSIAFLTLNPKSKTHPPFFLTLSVKKFHSHHRLRHFRRCRRHVRIQFHRIQKRKPEICRNLHSKKMSAPMEISISKAEAPEIDAEAPKVQNGVALESNAFSPMIPEQAIPVIDTEQSDIADDKFLVSVEVCLKPSSTARFEDVRLSVERIILLHGPPGTGKTSLCKALAQKLSIRFSSRYPQSQLIEVNAHSLFSKWFSESGKLVAKLFQNIQEMVEDENNLVFVLIDEVESLAAARNASLSGSEPSDSIRVVNALLTQLDKLKSSPNVIIMTTSNITAAIEC